jgi:general secretion pathway protein G
MRNQLRQRYSDAHGYSFVELLVVSAILLILASAIAPLSSVTMQRQRETELRRSLRELRTAIDGYKDAVDLGLIAGLDVDVSNAGYPPNLELLVEGIETIDQENTGRRRFLRRIPIDPMTKTATWGLRAYEDDAGDSSWGGENVYDVYTTSRGTALDGTLYRDW